MADNQFFSQEDKEVLDNLNNKNNLNTINSQPTSVGGVATFDVPKIDEPGVYVGQKPQEEEQKTFFNKIGAGIAAPFKAIFGAIKSSGKDDKEPDEKKKEDDIIDNAVRIDDKSLYNIQNPEDIKQFDFIKKITGGDFKKDSLIFDYQKSINQEDNFGITYNSKLENLKVKQANNEISPEEYVAQSREILEDAGVLELVGEVYEIEEKEKQFIYKNVFGISDYEVEKNAENLDEYVAKKKGISVDQLDSYIENKLEDVSKNLKTKYGLDISVAKQQQFSNMEENINSIEKIFSNTNYVLSDFDKNNFREALFPEDLVNGMNTNEKNTFTSLMYNQLIPIIKNSRGNAFKEGEDQEDGENMLNRITDVLYHPDYLNYQEKVAELVKRPEFYKDGLFQEEMFIRVLNDTTESKMLEKTLASEEMKADGTNLIDKFNLGYKQLQREALEKYGGDDISSLLGLITDPDFESKYKEKYIDGEFVEIKDAEKIELEKSIDKAFEKSVEDNDMSSWNVANNFLNAIIDNPVNYTQSKSYSEFQRTIIQNDPNYYQNKYKVYGSAMINFGEMLYGKPSDVGVAIASAGAFSALSKGIQVLSKTKKMAGALKKASALTITNMSNPNVRKTSQIVYKGLKSMFEPGNNAINFYFAAASNSPGTTVWDFGIDFAIGAGGRLYKGFKGAYKTTNQIYDLYNKVSKSYTAGTDDFYFAMKKELLDNQILRDGMTKETMSSPSKMITAQQLYDSSKQGSKNLVAELYADAVRINIEEGGDAGERFMKEYLPLMKEKYTDAYKLYKTDEDFVLAVLKKEGSLNVDNYAKYKFLKVDTKLMGKNNPLKNNIDSMIEEYRKLEVPGVSKELLNNQINRFRDEMYSQLYGVYNLGKIPSTSEFNKTIKNFQESLINQGGEEVKSQLVKLGSTEKIDNAIGQLDELYNKSLTENALQKQDVWNNLPDYEKKSIFDGVQEYLTKGEVDIVSKKNFLKKLGFDKKEIDSMFKGDVFDTNNLSKVDDKVAGKFNNGTYIVDKSDFNNKVKGVFNSIGDQKGLSRLKKLSKILDDLSKGRIEIYNVTSDVKSIVKDISPYLNLNAIDNQSLILSDMAQISALDNLITTSKAQDIDIETIQQFIDSYTSGLGDRIFGSLKNSIRRKMRIDLQNVNDLKGLYKRLNIQEGNVDELLAKYTEKKLSDYVLGGKGMITGNPIDDAVLARLDNSINAVVEKYIKGVEDLGTFIANKEVDDGLVAGVSMIGKSAEEPLYKEAIGKSFDEFVKTQGTPVYHGTNTKLIGNKPSLGYRTTKADGTNFNNKLLYFSDDFSVAEGIANNRVDILGGTKNIEEFLLKPKKIIDFGETNESYFKALKNIGYKNPERLKVKNGDITNLFDTDDFVSKLKSAGYDTIKFKEKGASTYATFDKDVIKTESQLKQIREEANSKGLSNNTSGKELIKKGKFQARIRNKNDVLNSGIDFHGASKTISKEDVLEQIDNLDSDQLSKLVSTSHYNDPVLSNEISRSLNDEQKIKWTQAIDLAKARKNKALGIISEMYDRTKGTLAEKITVDGQEYLVKDVLNNFGYKITSDGLITTSNHNLVKYIANDSDEFIDDAEKIFVSYVNSIDEVDAMKKFDYLKKIGNANTPEEGFRNLVDGVYKRIEELSDKETASDVVSRLIVGMPQYLDDMYRLGKIDDTIIDIVAKKIVSLNQKKAVGKYVDIYNDILSKIKVDESILGKLEKSLKLKFMGNRAKNYELALMDNIINDVVGSKPIKISQGSYDDLIRKAMIGDQKTIAIKNINKILKQYGVQDFIDLDPKINFRINEYANNSQIVGDVNKFMKDNEKKLRGMIGDKFDEVIAEINKYVDGVPEDVIKNEIKIIEAAGDYNLPEDKILSTFKSDVDNAALVREQIQQDIETSIVEKMTSEEKSRFNSSKVSDVAIKTYRGDATKLQKSINEISKIDNGAMDKFLEDMDKFDAFGKIFTEDGVNNARKFLYESDLSKQFFEFNENGLKSEVIKPQDSYQLQGEVRMYQDVKLNNWHKAFSTYTKVFSNILTLGAKDKTGEIVGLVSKAYRSKTINLTNDLGTSFANVAKKLFPESKSSKVYLQTFLNKWKKSMGKDFIKQSKMGFFEGNGIKKGKLMEDFSKVFQARYANKVNMDKWLAESGNKEYYEMIDSYFLAVQQARKQSGLSMITYSREATDKMPEIVGNYNQLITPCFMKGGDSVQSALNSLEGLNGLWLGLDVNDINRVKSNIEPFLGPSAVRRFLINSNKNSSISTNFGRFLWKGYKEGERHLSAAMYGMLFNPVTSRQLGSQQIIQNKIHSMINGLQEIGAVNVDELDSIMKYIDEVKPFDYIEGEISQFQLGEGFGFKVSGDGGLVNSAKKILNGLDKKMMSSSAQSIADRTILRTAKNNALTSAFLEYGYNPETINQLLKNIGSVGEALDGGLDEFTSLAEIFYKNEDMIAKSIAKKMDLKGFDQNKIDEVVGQVLEQKRKIGNVGELVDNYYSKVGMFFQFANMPEVAGSFATTMEGSFAFMKFANWSSKKSSEYFMDFATAIAKGDKGLLGDAIARLGTEALYTAKAYSYLDRLLNEDDNENIDPMSFALAMYSPLLAVNMTLFNVISMARNKLYLDDKLGIDGEGMVLDKGHILGGLSDTLSAGLRKSSMSVIYFANMLLQAGGSMDAKKKLINGVKNPDETAFVGSRASNFVETFNDTLLNRSMSKTHIKMGGRYYPFEMSGSESFVNNLVGESVTDKALKTERAINEATKVMYGGKDTDISASLYFSKNYDAVDRATSELVNEVGANKFLAGTDIARMANEYDRLYTSTAIDSLEKRIEGVVKSGTESEAARIALEMEEVGKTYGLWNKIKSTMTKYNVLTDGRAEIADDYYTPKMKEDIEKMSNEIYGYVLENVKGNRVVDNSEIYSMITKYQSPLGQEVYYMEGLQAALDGYEANQQKLILQEMGLKKLPKEGNIRTKVYVEVAKRGKVFSQQLISDSWETLTSLNDNLGPEIANEFMKMNYPGYGESITSLSDMLRMQQEAINQKGLAYLGNTNNILSFGLSKSLGTIASMPSDTEEEIKEKTEAQSMLIKDFTSMYSGNGFDEKLKAGASIALFDNINSLTDETKEKEKDILQNFLENNTVSTPLSDGKTLEKIYDKYGLLDSGGGSGRSGSISKTGLGNLVVKLNKAQQLKEAIIEYKNLPMPAVVTRYKLDGDTILPLKIESSKIQQTEDKMEFLPKPVISEKKAPIAESGTIKKVTSKKFTPKTIKKIKSKF